MEPNDIPAVKSKDPRAASVYHTNSGQMDAERDTELAIGWNRINLRFIGAWPGPVTVDEDKPFTKYRFLIPVLLMFGFIGAPQIVSLFMVWGDIDDMMENLARASMIVMSTIMKVCTIRYYKEDLRPLVESFVKDWQNEKTERERSIMMKHAILARKISIGCTILSQTGLTAFVILRLGTIVQLDRATSDRKYFPLYQTYFPYDVRQSPALELTFFMQIVSAYCTTTSYTAVDSFMSMLALHVCGQFELLQCSLERTFEEETGRNNREKFAKIVKRHEHLNRFVKKIEKCFNKLLFVQVLVYTVQMCFQGFQVSRIVAHDGHNLSALQLSFLAIQVAVVLVHLYLYCYMGEIILMQSSKLSLSAYKSKWYNVPAKDAKGIMLIMLRTTMPLCLTAGEFSTFSLEMFSSILKTSMGYLSVLLTVTSRID